jgi:hypothetical protein
MSPVGRPIEREYFPEHESDLCKGLTYIGRILEDPDYYVWGCSPVYDDQGKVHVYFARWHKKHTRFAWCGSCEIAHAVGDSPEGPFRVEGVAVEGRGGDAWDGWAIHNPNACRVDGRYYIFFMATTGKALGISREKAMSDYLKDQGSDVPSWESHRRFGHSPSRDVYWHLLSEKRVGCAVADDPYGPWERVSDAGPLIDAGEEGAWDDFLVTNPAYLAHPDGSSWLYYKGCNRREMEEVHGNRRYGVAIADSIEGPYEKHPGNPVVDLSTFGDNKQLEDAYVFVYKGKIHLVCRDMEFFNHTVGLHFTSDDGIQWEGPTVAYYGLHQYDPEEPVLGLARESQLERPQVLMRDGVPEYLYVGVVGGIGMTSSGAVLRIDWH